MNWLNLRLTTLRAPEYIGSDPVARATWLNVAAYCAEQENGGRIKGGKAWKDRQWQQTCGVMLSEVDSAHKLLIWDGDDLVVWNYPADKEDEVKLRREGGKIGGNRSGKARAKQSFDDDRSSPSRNPLSSPSRNPRTEGEGEGKEKEKENGKPPRSRSAIDFALLPAELDSAEFRDAWTAYVEYRKQRKIGPLMAKSVELQWKKMREWGSGLAIIQIEATIANGWQGIFAPKEGAKAPEKMDKYEPTADELAAFEAQQAAHREAKAEEMRAALEALRLRQENE